MPLPSPSPSSYVRRPVHRTAPVLLARRGCQFILKAVAESDFSLVSGSGSAIDIAALLEYKAGDDARLQDHPGAVLLARA